MRRDGKGAWELSSWKVAMCHKSWILPRAQWRLTGSDLQRGAQQNYSQSGTKFRILPGRYIEERGMESKDVCKVVGTMLDYGVDTKKERQNSEKVPG